MKKQLLVLALSIASASALASNFDGFYVGLGGSAARMNASVNQTVDYIDIGRISTSSYNLAKSVYMGNVLAGYGMTFNNLYYLGAEAGYTTNTQTASTSNENYFYKITQSFSLASQVNAGLLAGVLANPNTLFYLRADALNANISAIDNQTDVTAIHYPGYYLSSSNNRFGLGLGVGARYSFNQNFQLGAQAEYQTYTSVTTSSVMNEDGSRTHSMGVTPTLYVMSLDAIYRF